jgi:hypothetical protein
VVTDGRQFCSKVNVIGCSLFSGRVNSFILIFYNVMQVESLPCSAVLMSSLSPEQRPCLSRRVTVQEQISSSFMDSPPPPHLDAPLFGADLIPSGRLRRMRGWRHSPGGLEEEVRHTIALHCKETDGCSSPSRLLTHINRIDPWPADSSCWCVGQGR